MGKLIRGEGVRVVAVGGSVTAGAGAYRGNVYHKRYMRWLNETFPVTCLNASSLDDSLDLDSDSTNLGAYEISSSEAGLVVGTEVEGTTIISSPPSPPTSPPPSPPPSPSDWSSPSPEVIDVTPRKAETSSSPSGSESYSTSSPFASDASSSPPPPANLVPAPAPAPEEATLYDASSSVEDEALSGDHDDLSIVSPASLGERDLTVSATAQATPSPHFSTTVTTPTETNAATSPSKAATTNSAENEDSSSSTSSSSSSAAFDSSSYYYNLAGTLPAHEPLCSHELVVNALGSTPSTLFSGCFESAIDQTGDLYIVDFTLNDPIIEQVTGPTRVSFERLLRQILLLPQAPAVIVLGQWSNDPSNATFFYTPERQLSMISQAYDVAFLSMRDAIWPLLNTREGFYTNGTFSDDVKASMSSTEWDALMASDTIDPVEEMYLFYDTVHPADQTGHRVLSDLLVEYTQRAGEQTARALPDWFVSGDYMPESDATLVESILTTPYNVSMATCVTGDAIYSATTVQAGFAWTPRNASASTYADQNWAYIATAVGSSVSFVFDSRILVANDNVTESAALVDAALLVLQSPAGYGTVSIECSGCACDQVTNITGTWNLTETQNVPFAVPVTVAQSCEMTLTLIEGDRFELRGVVVVPHQSVLYTVPNSQGDFFSRPESLVMELTSYS